jgi:hypothetical protein
MPRVARRRRGKQSTSGYFRVIFQERPDLLDGKSNEELISRWVADHPNHTEKELRKTKANLANLKSILRKQKRTGRGNGRGRPAGGSSTASTYFSGRPTMDRLEEHIDECLTQARTLDRDGLESVIKLLRRARNEVVWKLGQ